MSQHDVEGMQDPEQPQNDAQNMRSPDQSQRAEQGMKASGESHKMSIALIIGATIGLIGLILLLYGLFGSPEISRSDNINIDLWWGLVMLVFGLLMGTGGYIAARRAAAH